MTLIRAPNQENLDSVASSPKARILAAVALLLVAAFAARQLSTWPQSLRYGGEACGIEGMRLAEMQHLRQGIPIYAPASAERFDAAIYGPLYYLLGSRLIDPDNPAYFPFRLLSLLAVLGCSVAAGWLAFCLSGRALAAALAPCMFLSYGLVSFFGLSARADSVALLFTFFGVLLAYHYRGNSKIVLAVPFFLLSAFYKQQFVAAPLAVILFLVLERRTRLAAAFAALMAGGVAGFLALFQFVLFRGQDFFLHFFLFNLVPFSWSQFKGGLIVFVIVFLVPILVGLESLRVRRERFLGYYLAVAAVLAILGVGKQGSAANYFLECIFLLCVLFAALLAKRIAEPARAFELLVLFVVALTVELVFTPSMPTRRDFELDRAVQGYLRANFRPGTRALSYFAGDMIRAGLELPVSDIYQFTWLTRTGVLDDRSVVLQLQKHEYGLVAVDIDLETEKRKDRLDYTLTESVRRTIQAEYRLTTTLELPEPEKIRSDARLYIWVPRTEAGADSPPR